MKRAWRETAAPALRGWWGRHGPTVLAAVVLAMIAGAIWRIGNELPRLLWETGGDGAFDLQLRHREVHRWFSGLPIYNDIERGDYPPASYVILWPLIGWLDLAHARLAWAVTGITALAWLSWMMVRESTATTRLQMLLIMLLPFSSYAASAAIRVGQVGNHVMPVLLAGLLILFRGKGRLRDDLAAAALLAATLVKPTFSAAFFWIVCFVPGSKDNDRWRALRPIATVVLGYAVLTAFAITFQEGDARSLLFGWTGEPPQLRGGHANVQKWLALAGLRGLAMPVSVGLLLALAAWVHRYRRADAWIVLGVTALVARLFIHHRLYDDMLVLLPMVTLFRIARSGPRTDGGDVMAGLLFAAVWVSLHAPASWLQEPPPLSAVMEAVQSAVWLSVLVFLLGEARRDRSVRGRASGAPSLVEVPGGVRSL